MEIKKLSACVGAGATICVAMFSWGYGLSREVTSNSSSVTNLKTQLTSFENRVERELNTLHKQNTEISSKLTDLLHKQDVRISLLEASLINTYEENKNGR